LGERFGFSTDDIVRVLGWLRNERLHVDTLSNSRMIDFSGTAASAGAAFSTEMRYY
jgi:hypothetical protein